MSPLQLVLCLCLCLCLVPAVFCSIFSPEEEGEISRFVESVMECRGLPGLTLGVVKGAESWTHGYGMADRERNISVGPDTLFSIGSVTKAFTSTLLAMLINDTSGRLSWTTKVKDILGSEFKFSDEERTRETTLRDLLVHRTGLMTVDLTIQAGYSDTVSRAELAKRTRLLPEVRPFRDRWEYSNWMYFLAGHVIEVMSRDSYEGVLEERIFKPLGMRSSKVLGKTASTTDPEMAKPYFNIAGEMVLTDPDIYNIYPYEPVGAIVSSAKDMVKWMQFILHKGQLPDNTTLVDSELISEAFDTHISIPKNEFATLSFFPPIFPASDLSYGYGYAWFQGSYRGYRKFWHGGDVHSYKTYLCFYPDLDSAIFISINGISMRSSVVGLPLIQDFVTDILLGEKPWLNETSGCTFPEPWMKTPSQPQKNTTIPKYEVLCMACYVGNYGHQLYGDLQVKGQPGFNQLMLHYGRLTGTLNTTDEQEKFKFDIGEPYRLMSRPGNETSTIDVVFSDLLDGFYQRIDIVFPYPMSFYRNTSFADELTTSGQGTLSVHALSVVTVVILQIAIWSY